MNFLEKDLETIIFETPNEKLKERGLFINGKKKRQLNIGSYGTADVVLFKRGYDIEQFHDIDDNLITITHTNLSITVLELKQNKIDCNTLMQAARYCRGIQEYICSFRDKDVTLNISIILIGKEVSLNGDFAFLLNDEIMPKLSVYTYGYDFDGIKFSRQEDFVKGDNGFKLNKDPF